MKTVHRLLVTSVAFGLLSLALFILGGLAMTDIFHEESDLTLEWRVVTISFLPILFFHVFSVAASLSALRFIKGNVA
jgi:hypothetical protein